MAKEILDIVDDNGQPTGEVIDRVTAHREGILHRTSHVWLVRIKDGRQQVLLQKRSEEKDSYPGCYDISSAGHIPAGVDFVPSALRELKEELGVEVQAEDVVYCGQRKFHFEEIFHGERFKDNQISNVYCLWRDVEPEQLKLQPEEVEEVCWMSLDDCREAVCKGSIPNCISMEELEMLPRTFKY